MSVRNTSSSVGRRRARSSTPTPASLNRRTASTIAPLRPPLELTQTTPSCEGRIAVGHRREGAGGRRRRSAPGSRRTSSRSPPTRSLSSSDVPCAIKRPWSITAIVFASRSASSRYWVVSSTVVPSATRPSITSHRLSRLRGSRPVVGSSRNSTGGLATSAAPRSSRRRMPARVGLRRATGCVGQVEALEQLGTSGACLRSRVAVQPADHRQVLEAGEVLVDRGVLTGEPDLGPELDSVPNDIEARDRRSARVGLQQCGEDADHRRLPGAVRAEQTEHGAPLDVEVDARESVHITERLLDAAGADRSRLVHSRDSSRRRGQRAGRASAGRRRQTV